MANARIIGVAAWATALHVSAAPAPFEVGEPGSEYVPLAFDVEDDRVYAVLEERLGDEPPRLVLVVRDAATGEHALPDIEVWNEFGQSPVPRLVAVEADTEGATILLADGPVHGIRVSSAGQIVRSRQIDIPSDPGLLHGTAGVRDHLLAVFSGGVASIDRDFVAYFVPVDRGRIGAFALEGDTLWTVHFEGRHDAVLRALSLDGSPGPFADIALPPVRSLPLLVAWPGEVVLIAATPENDWLRCVHPTGADDADCGPFNLDTRAPFLDLGTIMAQAFEVDDESYVVTMPHGCGMWIRRYGRNHEPTRLQLTPPDGNRLSSVRFAAVDGAVVGMGVRFGSGTGRQSKIHAAFGDWRPAPAEPSPVWAAACPAWKEMDFFADASADEVLDCIAAGAPVDDGGICDDGSSSPLSLAAALTDDPAVIDALIHAGADPDRQLLFGSTALHHAVSARANPRVVERLIDAGADINALDDLGKLPIDYASGDALVAEVLSNFGKDETQVR